MLRQMCQSRIIGEFCSLSETVKVFEKFKRQTEFLRRYFCVSCWCSIKGGSLSETAFNIDKNYKMSELRLCTDIFMMFILVGLN